MDRRATSGAEAASPTDIVPGLDGVPRQRTVAGECAHVASAETACVGVTATAAAVETACVAVETAPAPALAPAAVETASVAVEGAASVGPSPRRRVRPWRLLPTPTGTPFTLGYAAILAVTSLFTEFGDADLVERVLQGSSTDVAHLVQSPVHVLVASALWVAGGITSTYVIAFLLVLTALERRIGGWRTAGVFLLGHVLATLATEIPVGLSVLVGHLPESSLHRYDYGISFGVAASLGALAGLLTPWLRWTVLGAFGWMVVDDLIAFTDPLTNWGHLMALAIGVATWPLLRRSEDTRRAG